MTTLTDHERHVMRHALGLTNRKVAYRNRFISGGSDIDVWRSLVSRGLAHEHKGTDEQFPRFCVRLWGVLAVLRDGERLDGEEADYVMRLEASLAEPAAIEVAA